MNQPMSPPTIPVGAGFFRRMGAWLYDLLILIALEMFAVGIAVGVVSLATYAGLSLEGYVDVSDFLARDPTASPLFTLYVFGVAAYFYAYFWSKAGQTIGMKAWRLEIVSEFGGRISFTQGLIRLATSCFGLGNLFVFFSPSNRAFQDLFSHSQIVHKK